MVMVMDIDNKNNGVKCVLLDIEGTVCPISFVKETLFPYALRALPHVLATHWHDPTFQPYRDAFPAEHRESPAHFRAHVQDLTRRDIKIAYLKNLQGYLWEDGYTSGAYATDLFPDVVAQLRAWKRAGLALAIYSSGSVFAQKLLFAHVRVRGDHDHDHHADADAHADADVLPNHDDHVGAAADMSDGHPPSPPVARVLGGDAATATPGAAAAAAAATPGTTATSAAASDAHDLDASARPDGPSVATTGTRTTARTSHDPGQLAAHDDDACPSSDATVSHDQPPPPPPRIEDVTALFDAWFDTTTAGLKTEPASYAKIADSLMKWHPHEILFLSDNVREVDAALAAGMQSIVVDRPGNAPLDTADRQRLRVVDSLSDIHLSDGVQ